VFFFVFVFFFFFVFFGFFFFFFSREVVLGGENGARVRVSNKEGRGTLPHTVGFWSHPPVGFLGIFQNPNPPHPGGFFSWSVPPHWRWVSLVLFFPPHPHGENSCFFFLTKKGLLKHLTVGFVFFWGGGVSFFWGGFVGWSNSPRQTKTKKQNRGKKNSE